MVATMGGCELHNHNGYFSVRASVSPSVPWSSTVPLFYLGQSIKSCLGTDGGPCFCLPDDLRTGGGAGAPKVLGNVVPTAETQRAEGS